MAVDFFDSTYTGTPPWDIGRPQSAFVRLAEAGRIRGSVLDVGCGTGENALFLAKRNHEVTGVDSSPKAIAKASQKTQERGLHATFLVHDAMRLNELGRTFDTVIDSGLFHVFSDHQRIGFVSGLSSVLTPGGMYYMLCFSDRQPGWGGPRRVSKDEIRSSFSNGWAIESIDEATFEDTMHHSVRAWLACIERHD